MRHTPPTASGIITRSAVLTGLGFALGFGWLWFPALQDWWLPLFLWGTPWSGGGVSLLYVVLAAGFLGYGFIARFNRKTTDNGSSFSNAEQKPPEATSRDFRLTGLPHLAHGLTLILVLIGLAPSLFTPLRLSGAWLFLPVVCMALAGVIQGIFWAGAILALPARAAMAAYATALLSASLSGYLCFLVSGRARTGILLVMIIGAWRAAAYLRRILREPYPEPRKTRGRPPKKISEDAQEAMQTVGSFSPGFYLAACGAAFCLFATGQSLLEPGAVMEESWFAGLLPFLGVAATFLFVPVDKRRPVQARGPDENVSGMEKRFGNTLGMGLSPSTALFLAIAFWGVMLLIGSLGRSVWLAGGFLEGVVCSLAIISLTGEFQPSETRSLVVSGKPWVLASLTLGATLILAVTGVTAGQGLSAIADRMHAAWTEGLGSVISAIHTTGILSLIVACIFFISVRKRSGKLDTQQKQAPDEQTSDTPAAPTEYSAFLEGSPSTQPFTEREMAILTLILQGMTNRQIASQLDVQEGTVRFHLRNIYQKTGLSTREELAELSIF